MAFPTEPSTAALTVDRGHTIGNSPGDDDRGRAHVVVKNTATEEIPVFVGPDSGLATEATLAAFKDANHTDLLGVQTRIDSSNTKLDTIHSDLTTIESKQDAQTAQLTAINANTDTLESLITASNVQLSAINSNTDTLEPLITSTNTKLDTLHADLVTVEGKQDSQTTQLAAINANTDDLENRLGATNETIAPTDTSTSGLNGLIKRLNQHLTTVEGKQDSQTTQLTAINANTDTLETLTGSLTETAPGTDTASSGLNGRLQRVAQNISTTNTNLGAQGDAAATSDTGTFSLTSLFKHSLEHLTTIHTRLGATNETAPASDTATSGLNGRLQRIAQRLTSLIAFYAADFGVSSASIRVAAQVGNATGAANFGAGATGAQTLRVASNTYDGSANAITSQVEDTRRGLDVSANSFPEFIMARTGQMFHAHSNSQALTGTIETALFLFLNPNGSGKTAKLFRINFGPTLGNNYVTYRIYRDPTVTVNGTGLAENGNRDTGQNAAVVTTFSGPTVSANGSFYGAVVLSGLSGFSLPVPYNFSLWVEPNHSLLITRQLSANATIGGVGIEWGEQA